MEVVDAVTLFHKNSQSTNINIREALEIHCTKIIDIGQQIFVEVISKFRRGPMFEPQCMLYSTSGMQKQ